MKGYVPFLIIGMIYASVDSTAILHYATNRKYLRTTSGGTVVNSTMQ